MRLKHLHIIGEYKNLKNFELNFDGTSFIDVFVGKNGTGKSNLFEAFLEIFKHLFDNAYPIRFNYKLQYEIAGREVKIHWEDTKWLDSDGKNTVPTAPIFLPKNILIYYSGHNDNISKFIEGFNVTHRNKLNRNRNNELFNPEDARLFFGIGKEYKNILLASTLLQSDDLNLKQIIKQKLSIDTVSSEIKLVFEKPFFASKDTTFDEFDPNARFWGAQGYFRGILNEIWEVNKIENPPVRDEGRIEKEDSEEYILYRSFEDFKNKFSDKSIFEIFITLDNLKTIGLLKEIDIEVQLMSGKKISLAQFSDGQFQSVYILSITEIFKEFNCISLLDEPDAFLHPEWQFDFFKQITDISAESSKSNHILMSSHSAVTLVPNVQKKIKLFRFVDNEVKCHDVSKTYAINQLSSNLMRLSENEQILSVLNSINIEKKPVFFTEGSTDPVILKIAWEKLYQEPMPFIPIMAFNCVYLRSLLQDERIFNELDNKPMFGLFDFDEAYNEWNYLKGNRIETNPYNGLLIDVENKNSFAFMLPIPEILAIENQVVKNKATKETFVHESKMAIEHLFYGDPNTHSYFKSENKPGGGSIIVFKEDKKTKFANEEVVKIDPIHFEVFRPMFEFVKSRC